ncbi:MAG: BadF/BadG/BcrA/BcrD ATPase family protein [Xanthobacteraceae bacterium]
MNTKVLLLGVDGGGTSCRARLCAFSGQKLGEATTGPANLRLGPEQSFSEILRAATQCLSQAGLPRSHLGKVVACLALAGASEPSHLAAARSYPHPFRRAIVTTDAHAACLGAHGENDGGVIVAGTGTVGWAVLGGQTHRVGGWGMPISDEGSGAWLGCEAVCRLLWALDGRLAWTGLLHALGEKFGNDPHAIVTWAQSASPGDFGSLAPDIFAHATRDDPIACELVALAAGHIDILADRLIAIGATRLALVGGCAPFLASSLSERTKSYLVEPAGDALSGALYLARSLAQPLAEVA